MQAYARRRWQEAFEAFEWLAKHGDAFAQVWVGNMYIAGRGVCEDKECGRAWLEHAAYTGNAEAKYALGRLCFSDHDFVNAIERFRDAAQGDFFPASFWLGVINEH